jgi:hypothetical protein
MASVPSESAAAGAASRIRELGLVRQAALKRARGYRLSGQLVPGSLRDELAENEHELELALGSYAREKQGA